LNHRSQGYEPCGKSETCSLQVLIKPGLARRILKSSLATPPRYSARVLKQKLNLLSIFPTMGSKEPISFSNCSLSCLALRKPVNVLGSNLFSRIVKIKNGCCIGDEMSNLYPSVCAWKGVLRRALQSA